MRHLVVHIGTGKTGSTAIQQYMKTNSRELLKRKIDYWGINLEHATSAKRFAWQIPTGIGILQQMPEEQARDELRLVLSDALSALGPGHTAVWSNESIFERPGLYSSLLDVCKNEASCELTVLAYARSIREYIVSAYKQWGIKHKTYKGRIKSFTEWTKSMHSFLSSGKALSYWHDYFPNNFKLVNYDHTPDVVSDFVCRLPHCQDLIPKASKQKENLSPGVIPLALYALYNNQFSHPVLPDAISSLLGRYKLTNRSYALAPFSDLFPSRREIDRVEAALADDISMVNTILKQHGQPALLAGKESHSDDALTENEITRGVLAMLLTLAVEQEKRIQKLEERLGILSPPTIHTE